MSEDEDMEETEEDDDFEEQPYFAGCTCIHDRESHGWTGCDVDGCRCEGGWEE